MLFNDLTKKFIETLTIAGRAKETLYNYSRSYVKFGGFLEKQHNSMVYFRDITFENIEDFFKYLKEQEKLSDYSLKHYYNRLNVLFNYAVAKQEISTNLMNGYPKFRSKAKEKQSLTEEEAELIISNIGNKTAKMIVELLYYCGLRTSEVMSLELNDIDMKGETILIRKTKSGGERIVPMSDKAKKMLKKYIESDREKVKSEILFVNYKATKVTDASVAKHIKNAQKISGLDHKNVSPHIFRHSFATNLLRKNVNMRIIQKLLGHAQITTTMTYLHSSREELKQAVDLL